MKSILTLSASVLLPMAAFAGETLQLQVQSGKDKTVLPEPCFKANEWELDLFGAYTDGPGLDHAGPFQDHAWGGGLGVNYFFTRNLGIGIDGQALYGQENRQNDGRSSRLSKAEHSTAYAVTGSLIFRLPFEKYPCYAPFVYAGGGYTNGGDEWASAHIGYGSEYRIVPGKVAIFFDSRFTYYGDRYGHGDQYSLMNRLGLRFIF